MEDYFPGQFQMPQMGQMPPMERRVEIKAGRMTMDEGNTVRPDRRRGKIVVEEVPGEGITRFKWSDINDSVTEEYIVFPPADRFCKALQTEDRVFVLEYSGQYAFYWIQEDDKTKDAERIKRINEIMGNGAFTGFPGAPGSASSQPAAGPGAESGVEMERRNQLASILEQFASENPIGPAGPALHEILTPEVLDKISSDEDIFAMSAEHLPEGQQDMEGFRRNLLSPQFQQSLLTLGQALRSEIGEAVLASFGLHNVQVEGVADRIEKLIRAIEKKTREAEEAAKKGADEA